MHLTYLKNILIAYFIIFVNFRIMYSTNFLTSILYLYGVHSYLPLLIIVVTFVYNILYYMVLNIYNFKHYSLVERGILFPAQFAVLLRYFYKFFRF